MDNKFEEFNIYKFINSKDVAEHCRNIMHQFTTAEMAKIIFMSRLPSEEKMRGYKWLIDNMPDEPIPDIKLFIPHFALWGGKKDREKRFTEEEIRTRTKVYKGRESVLEYLKQCISSGQFVDLSDGRNCIKSIDIHIPHPFKVGDVLENIITGEACVVDSVGDRANEISGLKSRSQFCLGLYRRDDSRQLPVMMEVSFLCYHQNAEEL